MAVDAKSLLVVDRVASAFRDRDDMVALDREPDESERLADRIRAGADRSIGEEVASHPLQCTTAHALRDRRRRETRRGKRGETRLEAFELHMIHPSETEKPPDAAAALGFSRRKVKPRRERIER